MEHNPIFKELDELVGTEGYKEILASVSLSSLKGAKFVAGKTADTFKATFNKATRELIKTVGTNNMKISQAEKQAKNHHPALFFDETTLKQVSSSGGADSLLDDAKNLIDALKEIKGFSLEVQTYNEKQLGYFKQYTSIKKTEDAVSVLQGLEKLKFPAPKFPHKENVMLVTNILPRRKAFSYNTQTHSCDIIDEEPTRESNENSLSSQDVTALLKEVEKLNDNYKVIAKANQDYIGYLKKFNIVVKESFEYLDKLEDTLSPSIKRDLLSRLEGDKHAFSFYTGFLPKVVNYADGYINILTSYLISKTN